MYARDPVSRCSDRATRVRFCVRSGSLARSFACYSHCLHSRTHAHMYTYTHTRDACTRARARPLRGKKGRGPCRGERRTSDEEGNTVKKGERERGRQWPSVTERRRETEDDGERKVPGGRKRIGGKEEERDGKRSALAGARVCARPTHERVHVSSYAATGACGRTRESETGPESTSGGEEEPRREQAVGWERSTGHKTD